MDDRYLKQNLYNLQEKYDCGGITPRLNTDGTLLLNEKCLKESE